MHRYFAALFLTFLVLPGHSSASDTTPTAGLEIRDAWSRETPPGKNVGVGYASLRSMGSDRRIVDARSDVAGRIELHTHVLSDGLMRMRRVESIELPADQPVELAPGGLHLMLFRLTAPLKAGERFPLVFVLDDGSEVSAEFEVRASAP